MTVPELLAASLSAHQASVPRAGKTRDLVALKRAADLRLEALALDPEMSDPAWTATLAGKHDAMMAFYRQMGVI